MNMVKALLLIGALIGLGGCGPEESSSSVDEKKINSKPENLIVWEDIGKSDALAPAIKSFEEKTGINVEVKEVEMSSQMKERIRLDGPAGTGPDVFTLPHDQIGQLAIEGILNPIDVNEKILNQFTDSSIDSQTYDGKVYGLPKAAETPVLIYNKKLMGQAPASMEELYALSKNTEPGQYGFLAVWNTLYFGFGVMGGMDGYIFDDEGGSLNRKDIGLNNDGSVKGAEYIKKWYQEGIFPKGLFGENGGATMESLFIEGKASAVMAGPWAFNSFREAGVNIGVAPLPKLPNGEPMKTLIGVKGWHVSSYSSHAKWAQMLVEHLSSEENARIRFETTGEIPPVKSLLNDPLIQDNQEANAVAIQSTYGVPMPNIPEMGEVWGPMGTALELITLDKKPTEEALDEAVKTIQSSIEANHQ